MYISIILPCYNEVNNLSKLIRSLINKILETNYNFEIIVVDDNSNDGSTALIKKLSRKHSNIKLIERVGRSGLGSAIKEGLLSSYGDYALVMDSDGQHDLNDAISCLNKVISEKKDLVIASRFKKNSKLIGLSKRREKGSSYANKIARLSLSNKYSQITDYMSGCFALNMNICKDNLNKIEINGFKFLYELLSVSKGDLNISEVPLKFNERNFGKSKLDIAIVWDFVISIIHSFTKKILPRNSISFALVGFIGIFVQLFSNSLLMNFTKLEFTAALPFAVLIAATSNYLINNLLTFRANRLTGIQLFFGLIKFWIISSLPVIANVGMATFVYKFAFNNTIIAQLVGIIIVFIWNYFASSRLIWNSR